MSFTDLIGKLETLGKSQSLDDANKDAKVAAAAADGVAAAGDGKGAGDAGTVVATGTEAKDKDGGDGDDELGKSFTLVLEDGQEVEGFDGTKLLKSLRQRVMTSEASIKSAAEEAVQGQSAMAKAIEVIAAQDAHLTNLAKSFGDQVKTITEQSELIKSLRADLDEVRNQSAGRRSVINPSQVSTANPLVKSLKNDEEGLQPQEFLAKCLDLQRDGKMSLQEVAMAEAAIVSNVAVHASIVNKVFSK